jgi:hypothetical protein
MSVLIAMIMSVLIAMVLLFYQVKEILKERAMEEASCTLAISVYDTERNEKAKLHREELVSLRDWETRNYHQKLYSAIVLFQQQRKAEEDAKKKHETEMDYLAPFLAQIGDPHHLSRAEAYKLKEECLQDLKQRLIDRANLIQARFEKVRQAFLESAHLPRLTLFDRFSNFQSFLL